MFFDPKIPQVPSSDYSSVLTHGLQEVGGGAGELSVLGLLVAGDLGVALDPVPLPHEVPDLVQLVPDGWRDGLGRVRSGL